MVSRTAWARAGPTRADTGPNGPIWAHLNPYGFFWAQKGPVLTNHLLTYHVTAPELNGLSQECYIIRCLIDSAYFYKFSVEYAVQKHRLPPKQGGNKVAGSPPSRG